MYLFDIIPNLVPLGFEGPGETSREVWQIGDQGLGFHTPSSIDPHVSTEGRGSQEWPEIFSDVSVPFHTSPVPAFGAKPENLALLIALLQREDVFAYPLSTPAAGVQASGASTTYNTGEEIVVIGTRPTLGGTGTGGSGGLGEPTEPAASIDGPGAEDGSATDEQANPTPCVETSLSAPALRFRR